MAILSADKWYLEIEVLDTNGCCGELFVGFAGTNFTGEHVGEDEASWGIDCSGFLETRYSSLWPLRLSCSSRKKGQGDE